MKTQAEKTTGYLYILTNSSIPGQVKIGKTVRHPEDRKKELSAATGVPTPFVLKYFLPFEDCHKAEKKLHHYLEKEGKRVSENKEFFRLELPEAIKIMDKIRDFEKNKNNKDDQSLDKDKASEFLKEGYIYLNGNGSVIKDYKKALEHFEQAGMMGSVKGEYMAGTTCEKITYNIKRSKEKQEWQQRALNHYNAAISLGDISSLAKASWIFRKFQQHQQANHLWEDFLRAVLKNETIEKEHTQWILRWLDNQKDSNFTLPFPELWTTHIAYFKKECSKDSTPNGMAIKLLKNTKKGFNIKWLFIIIINLVFLFLIFNPLLFSSIIWTCAFLISVIFSLYALFPVKKKIQYKNVPNKHKKNRKRKY